ncbi:MAG: Uma2 family endonuclease, partial [Rhodospirillales bacterium]
MTAVPKPWSVEQFVAWEEEQEDRYEFVDGVIRMMVGGTAAHSTIIGNVFSLLRHQLTGKPCRPFVETPKIVTDHFAAYPDVMVVCNRVSDATTVVKDPSVVVEVLSNSTRSYDLSSKWDGYRRVGSLSHGVFVDSTKVRVDVWSRDGPGGHVATLASHDAGGERRAIGCRLGGADGYAEPANLPP